MVQFLDELRLGLHGRTRRVLAPRGVKVVQRVQVEYRWRYLLLAVAPLTGELHWAWIAQMRQGHLQPVLEEWERIALSAYSPELNPAERVFEEMRARVEGVVYESLDAKQAEAETYLKELQNDPQRVRRLCNWSWLNDALTRLPPPAAV
jgi:hypothetical protein